MLDIVEISAEICKYEAPPTEIEIEKMKEQRRYQKVEIDNEIHESGTFIDRKRLTKVAEKI